MGTLDRLDLHPDGYHGDVLDYKTGNPAAAAKLRPALPEAATASLTEWLANPALGGGDYWRQGIFCRLLLAHAPGQPHAAATVTFDFLRPVAATPADEATVLAQIRVVDAAIRRHEFDPGCSQCRWCHLRANVPTRLVIARTASVTEGFDNSQKIFFIENIEYCDWSTTLQH